MFLKTKLKFVIYLLVATFVSMSVLADATTDHHVFENTTTTIQSSKNSFVQVTNEKSSSKEFFKSHAHPICSEHGHGHCCSHIINNFEEEYSLNLGPRQKNDFQPKLLFGSQFVHELIKPPIFLSLIS